jgi:hypothetical protein
VDERSAGRLKYSYSANGSRHRIPRSLQSFHAGITSHSIATRRILQAVPRVQSFRNSKSWYECSGIGGKGGGGGGQLSRGDEVTTSSDSPLRAQNRWRAFSLEPEVKKLIQADRRAVGMLEPTSWRFQGNAKDEARPGRTRRTATPYNENGLNAGVWEFFQILVPANYSS